MTPERQTQIETLFSDALRLPEEDRQRFVAESCGADLQLRVEVLARLVEHENISPAAYGSALPPTESYPEPESHPDPPTDPTMPDPMIGRRLGSYKITQEIGRGGMGAVYLARRADGEFRQRVAIKLIKRGMDTDVILRRFRNERQILARLDHPYIARLLDGGTTDDGLPYFVMEYIQGLPIFRYCDEQRLSAAERVKLFGKVSDAVHYAHRNLVIHRDIKPSNILVTANGIPKLLDFGIAKVLNPEFAADITQDPTATAMRVMTPEYASPEQVQGRLATPASDVYSLGVLLYELLTGHRPYRFRDRAPHEIARVVCEQEPMDMSSAITRTDGIISVPISGGELSSVESVCRARSSSVESLRKELSGDLNNIVMKAMRKEPEQRYKSVELLRTDAVLYLEGRPIIAPSYFPASMQHHLASESVTSEKSLAILPFKLLDLRKPQADASDGYLGIGLADALITRLSAIRRFTVRPTSSVIRYSAADSDPLAAARELATAFVLDGRIRRVGDSIRITVQLLDVRQGVSIWAGRFDEKFTDVLNLEDAITAQVAEAIVPHLTGDERSRLARRATENPLAHEAYMRGKFYWNSMTEDGFAKALVCFTRAVALDPLYALAYAGIADYYNLLGIYTVLPFHECAAAAKEAALKATAIDGTLAEAYSALAMATLTYDYNWKAAEDLHLKSLELNPNLASGHVWYGTHLAATGRFEEAISEAHKALELDPLSPYNHHTLNWLLYLARRYDESIVASRRLLSIVPGYGLGHLLQSLKLRYAGESKEAAIEEKKALESLGRTPFVIIWLAAGRAAVGETTEARKLLDDVEQMATKRYISPFLLAVAYCNLGDYERSISELERAADINDGWLIWLGVEPRLDPLRKDSRFVDLLKRTAHPLLVQFKVSPAEPEVRPPDTVIQEAPAITADTNAPHIPKEEAQQLYTAGRYYSIKRTADGLRQAIERFERAVEVDPDYALAYSELADCYALLNWYVEPPPPDAFDRALRAAQMAVEADDYLAEAHASLGFVKLYYQRDWEGAEREFRRAIELKADNAPAHRWYAFSLSALGRHEEAFAEIKRAQTISPKSAVIATGIANVLFLGRRFDEAIEQAKKALELDPGSIAAYVVLRWAYECMGMKKEAFAAYEQERVFAGDTPTTRAKRAHVLAACGQRAEARELLEELLARRDEQWVTAYEIAVIYALLDDADTALLWLNRAEQEHAVGFTFVVVDPLLDNIRSDPRFTDLLARISLPALQSS